MRLFFYVYLFYLFVLIFVEAEFLTMAEKMKPHVEGRMKIEPFPWLREYFVDMNKLFTELTLEKVENEVLGERKRILQGYEEMFNSDGRDKILTKGDQGMGKTTLGKKLGFDWAKGIFQKFSVIFFVQLKLVKPGEPIENVILEQHPELKGLNVSPQNVGEMLERFGNRCLLILDGLDEHGLGQNEDVLKVIKNETLLDCRIIVSSRPHSVNEVEQYFSTTIRVDGFTKKEAARYASNFFTEKGKIAQILQFKPSDSRENFPVHKCPILLSILCLLVKENEINLSKADATVGDLYLRMVQCLYRKFTNRKGTQYVESDFIQVMKSVGNLALQTLITNNPLLQKDEVLRIVGEFAFEYGFFSGHEDFRLCADPTADICVTYAHRSVEEFFGSFGFLQALADGKSVEDILGSDCEKPIFMVNPLSLQFCLWLQTKELFRHPQEIFDNLTFYVAERINVPTFLYTPFVERYPAMEVRLFLEKESMKMKFSKCVFEKCERIRTLHIGNQESTCVASVVGLMSPSLLSKLTLISIARNSLPSVVSGDDFRISIYLESSESYHEILNILLENSNIVKRNPQVCGKIESDEPHDLSKLVQKHVRQLELVWYPNNPSDFYRETLSASGAFPYCPQFTHFTAQRFKIDDSVPDAFMKAMKDGKFPNLRRIELSHCIMNDCEWPEVPEFLFVTGAICGAQKQNLLVNVTKLVNYKIDPLVTTLLPKLSVLKVEVREMKNLQCLNDMLRQGHLPNLSELLVEAVREEVTTKLTHFLHEFDPNNTTKLEKFALQRFYGLSQKVLRNLSGTVSSFHLRELDMSNSDFITGSLSALFTHSLPRLNTLILKSCDLNSDDLQSLAKAEVKGKLPQLEHLDISGRQNFKISDLFVKSAQWTQLRTLITNNFDILSIENQVLTSIEKLHFVRLQPQQTTITRHWPSVKVIQLDGWDNLAAIAEGVEQRLFPSLTTVKLKYRGMIETSHYTSLFKLYKANIFVQGISHKRRLYRGVASFIAQCTYISS